MSAISDMAAELACSAVFRERWSVSSTFSSAAAQSVAAASVKMKSSFSGKAVESPYRYRMTQLQPDLTKQELRHVGAWPPLRTERDPRRVNRRLGRGEVLEAEPEVGAG